MNTPIHTATTTPSSPHTYTAAYKPCSQYTQYRHTTFISTLPQTKLKRKLTWLHWPTVPVAVLVVPVLVVVCVWLCVGVGPELVVYVLVAGPDEQGEPVSRI